MRKTVYALHSKRQEELCCNPKQLSRVTNMHYTCALKSIIGVLHYEDIWHKCTKWGIKGGIKAIIRAIQSKVRGKE